MSFSRVKPAGWAVNEILTSAQMNSLDIDHANALDKQGIDTLTGVTTISGTGQIKAGVASGVLSNIAGGIATGVAGGIQPNIAAGIRSNVVGGIQLTGGSTDYPTFSPSRTRTITASSRELAIGLATGWTPQSNIPILNAPATNVIQMLNLTRFMHHGATLSSLAVYLFTSVHTSLPTTFPGINVFAFPTGAGSALQMSSTGAQYAAPGSLAAWSNLYTSWTYTANQNNVIDTTQYSYYALLTDENGANSVAGNQYYNLQFNFTSIADMRFA